ncbi:MAG: acyl-CoA dehydrogenase family protein [Deltaproteobacteria bacterium]|nr:acyl-CoA dehydrogenase family protein [Deltaproteobacteria bacterium]
MNTAPAAPGPLGTHEVTNQPPPLADFNAFEDDLPLVEALEREGGGWATERARAFGARAGSAEVIEWARLANENPPKLRAYDRFGHRIDEVEFHPAYHHLMSLAVEHGVHSLAWTGPEGHSHAGRAALQVLQAQAEAGTGCPITMAHSGIPALRHQPEVAAEWEPRLLTTRYDPRMIPASQKTGAIMGMAMTEKQGGSDVRANTTRATPIGAGGPGGEYELLGHKWFCSAPMSDLFLTLAWSEGGLSCFLVPRWTPDERRNPFYIQRLKDKLGNRSNASSEIEYRGTWARMVGAEGRGVPTIIEMVNHTRLDVALGASGLMRQALRHALHHTAHRSAFGRLLSEQPLMQNVLADLAVETEAAVAMSMRVARAFDEGQTDPVQRDFARIATAVAKYWVSKRVVGVVAEALECHGGAGYVEECAMARIYREAPLGSIWEGSGNVQCLDVLRAMHKSPGAVDAFFGELALARGGDARLDAHVQTLGERLRDPGDFERNARRLVEGMALALEGALLVRHAPAAVADAFCASRLSDDWGREYGSLPRGVDLAALVRRASAT